MLYDSRASSNGALVTKMGRQNFGGKNFELTFLKTRDYFEVLFLTISSLLFTLKCEE